MTECQSLLGLSDDYFGISKHGGTKKNTPYVKNLLDL